MTLLVQVAWHHATNVFFVVVGVYSTLAALNDDCRGFFAAEQLKSGLSSFFSGSVLWLLKSKF